MKTIAIKVLAISLFLPTISSAMKTLTSKECEYCEALEMMGSDDQKKVEEFITSHPDINRRYGTSKETLLCMAAANGKPKTIQLLIDSKAKIDQEDSLGWTPLMNLMHRAPFGDAKYPKAAELLLQNGSEIKLSRKSYLFRACENSEVMKVVERFMREKKEGRES